MRGIPLYRFEPADDKRILSLADNKLWFSDPLNFNDPFDFQLELQHLVARSGHDEEKFREAVKILFEDTNINSTHYLFSKRSLQFITQWATDFSKLGLRLYCTFKKSSYHFWKPLYITSKVVFF